MAAFFTTRAGSAVDELQLREYLRAKLPDYMLPGFLVALGELPLTPNGKIDRNALCLPSAGTDAKYGRQETKPEERQPDALEETLLTIWQDTLRSSHVGLHDDFFALGGHSLLGARLLARIERAFGVRLTLSAFFEAPTVAQMAALVRAKPVSGESRVFPIRAGDGRSPFYILHPDPVFRPLTIGMPAGLAVSGVSLPAAAELKRMETLEQIAAHEAAVLLESQPEGLFAIGGWCVDGVLAYEIAQQVRIQTGKAPLLVFFDSFNPARLRHAGIWKSVVVKSGAALHRMAYHAVRIGRAGPGGSAKYLQDTWQSWRNQRSLFSRPKGSEQPMSPVHYAARQYEPRPYEGPVLLFRAMDRPGGSHKDAAHGWRKLIPRLEVVDVPGNHLAMLSEPGAGVMAARIAEKIREQEAG